VASDAPVEAGPQTSPTFPGGPTNASWWIAGVISALIAATMLGWFLARGRARSASTAPALIAEYVEDESRAAGSFTVTVGPKSVTGSALGDAGSASELRPVVSLDAPEKTRTQSEVLPARILNPGQRRQHHDNVHAGLVSTLSQWLKQKLVRRLIADRANLVATQQASTLKVMKVDERLARIEAQLRDQNRAYERRIELLTAELSAAKEENRELIRAQIMKVKAEMEAARAKLVAETNDPAE